MKNLSISVIVFTLFLANLFVSYADTKQDIENANKKGKVVILVVTEKGNFQNISALSIAKEAQKTYPKSEVMELERDNTANSDLIQKYRLSGAPVPLILVIAKNGYVAGGAPVQNLTKEQIIKMIPSPKEEQVIKALNEGNSAFVVFSKKSDKSNKKQIAACKSACETMDDKAVTINVDIDDKNEKTLIEKFAVDKDGTFPVTYVINSQGQVVTSLNGLTEAKSLVEAAQKKVKSGCCPAGSVTSCGPKK